MPRRIDQHYPPLNERRRRIRNRFWNAVVNILVWLGMVIAYYLLFSVLFDTPVEHRMKVANRQLHQQYQLLDARMDTLQSVFANVMERDKNVFRILFESEPYDLDSQLGDNRWQSYDNMLTMNNKELGRQFATKMQRFEHSLTAAEGSFVRTQDEMLALKDKVDNIPSIQPIINKELTLLTASYGMRIHPFFKSLVSHQGIDYTVPEDTRVFATADGTVKDVILKRTSSGKSIVINHGNGYETVYNHLNETKVKKGQRVRRGDIIALTGNTGLSLSPHLHYEVRFNGMRVDPIHYFFMELTPTEYQKMLIISRSGMQSFD